ncbi:hypothetical protein LAZ67_11002572 [Cordylochernes scorpioides]|uniref:Uncharacterized protein n=1 Tax=Cordylochernes scorpioides TaxID=51811 RepID=A0ABY6L233_9ARAC|nr:hypothetical protein LAZ67_11002572 [Cordylochernes scorpioides]
MEKQITDGKELILIGDLNIRTGGLGGLYNPTNLQLSLVSERKARDLIISPLAEGLLEFLEDNSLTIINGRSTGDREGDFTFVSERGSSTIDYCIVSQGILEKISDFRIETQMYSDHLPLILKLTVQNTYENKSKGEEYGVTRYKWTAGGIKTFKQELKELQVVKISNLDSSVNTFTQRITEAMSTSGIMYSTKSATGKSKPWFDKNCYDMKKLTKESLKEFRRTNRKEDLESYAFHRKKYLGLLDDKRRKYIQEKQEILRNIKDSKSFWKTIALFKGATKIQGEITVQEWHEFYCELMSIEEKEKICNIEVRISPSDPILDPEITSEEIGRAIRDLKNNKASGPDDIPNEIIKVLPDSYMGLLEQFYNRALIMGHYPTIWTKSIIHPIFKSGDKDNPSNYRGIALISNFSKLFTTILRSRLNEWVERRNVIPENQAGFRRGRSCVDLIFTLTSLIQLSLRKKRGKLYVFFVDLRKEFDTVPHSLLWKKLTNLGVSYQFTHAIRNYYEQATVAVRWRGSITENIKIHSGVLQGEPLSPLLFILFMTDLIKMYDNSDLTSVYLPEFGDVHLLMYADDIAIIGESRVNLQKKINLLKEYLGVNEMTLNESKSKIMVFRNGGKPSREDRWYWNGKPLMVTGRYIYLGYPLEMDLEGHVTSQCLVGKQQIINYVSTCVIALKLTLKYWLRVLSMDTNRLPRICLTRMRQLSCATGAPIGFIKQLSNLLNNNGSSWLTYCNDPDSLRNAIPGILRTAIEQTIQNDLTRITQSKLYSHYRDIYTTFTTEEYFLTELPFPIIRLIAQFRTLSIFLREHHLILLRREDLKCTFCGSGITTEMLHYLFDCAALSEERRKLNDKTGQLCPSFPALIDEISKNRMVETRSGKMQDPAQERIMPEEFAKPQPGATIFIKEERMGNQDDEQTAVKDEIPEDNDFTPREYQVEIFKLALEQNTIALLGTGTGKTFISVMLIRHFSSQLTKPFLEGGKRTIFLVPTVPLAIQQCHSIRNQTNLRVESYYGSKEVDNWSPDRWQREFIDNQVLVMTAQVCQIILTHRFLALSQVNLMVFDECHKAVKNHPYCDIMKCFLTCPQEINPGFWD